MDNKDGNKVSFNSTGYTGYPKMETKLVLIFHGILKSLPNVALKLDILYHFHLQKDKKNSLFMLQVISKWRPNKYGNPL